MPYSEHKWRARRSNNSRPTNSLPCKPIKNNITNKKDLKCKGANRNFHVFRVYFLLVSRNTQVLFTSYRVIELSLQLDCSVVKSSSRGGGSKTPTFKNYYLAIRFLLTISPSFVQKPLRKV